MTSIHLHTSETIAMNLDLREIINEIFLYVNNGDVDKAVRSCLRLSSHLDDYFNFAVFLFEIYPRGKEYDRGLLSAARNLTDDQSHEIKKRAAVRWMADRKVEANATINDENKDDQICILPIGQVILNLRQSELSLNDLKVPQGMTAYATATSAEKNDRIRTILLPQIRMFQAILERVKARCFEYAQRIEKQLVSQQKSETFLHEVQNEVNNYFSDRAQDVYQKLQKATELLESSSQENYSLMLTEIRRAIKAVADYFYPANNTLVKCNDGQERILGDDKFLNRLEEFLKSTFTSSSSTELLLAEMNYLSVFARKLNDVASKGVHDEVTLAEAKQGLLGLYMFLSNLISHLQRKAK